MEFFLKYIISCFFKVIFLTYVSIMNVKLIYEYSKIIKACPLFLKLRSINFFKLIGCQC